jgi:hypothetical protein
MADCGAMRRLLAALIVVAATASSVPAHAGAPPGVAYYTDTGVEVATLAGNALSAYAAFQFFSLDGNLLVGSRHTRRSEAVVGFDATTGERRFKIANAFAPIALARGRKVAFLPDRFAQRDPYFSSVWLRTAAGRVRAIVRFAGPKATVDPADFDGEGIPLDMAWSANGNRAAITFGNDVDLFIYDVWVVNARTREATRVTRGHVSRFPSLSPSGDRLVVLREERNCGGPAPGYRAGDIIAMDADGSSRSTLLTGRCAVFYQHARWVSQDELIADRLTRTAPGTYDTDLVRVDATTGATTDLVTTGDVSFFSVSPALDAVAYSTFGSPGFTVIDLGSGTTTPFATGDLPHLAGNHSQI